MKLLTKNGKYNYMADNINISFVTFTGVDETVMLKRTEYGRKYLISSVNDVLEYMNVINETKVKLGGSKRIEESYFDYASFKEAWLNAVVHTRWIEKIPPAVYIFDDRIEIVSNSGLPKALNKEDFFKGISKPVNSALLNIFTNLDLIDQIGHGIPLILKKYGEKAFYISNNTIIVTIPINKNLLEKNTNNININETEKKVLKEIKANPYNTMSKISFKINTSESNVEKIIRKLKNLNTIKRVGSNKNGYWLISDNINI